MEPRYAPGSGPDNDPDVDEGTGSEPDAIRRLLTAAMEKLDDAPAQAASEVEHALGLIGEYDSDYGGWLRESWRWEKRWWICERCGTCHDSRSAFRLSAAGGDVHLIPTGYGSSSQACHGRLVPVREVRSRSEDDDV